MLLVAVARPSCDSNAIILSTSGFVDEVMFTHHRANKPESNVAFSSPGGGTGGEVCRLRSDVLAAVNRLCHLYVWVAMK